MRFNVPHLPANILKQEISCLTLSSQILGVAVIFLGIVVALGIVEGDHTPESCSVVLALLT